MQALLTINEFAYLLHVLEVDQVIGVDNARLFPADEGMQKSILEEGFNSLLEKGWLLAEGNTFRTNTALLLMCAVIAAPEQTIIFRRYLDGVKRQTITFYLVKNKIVQQFLTRERHYFVAQLNGFFEISKIIQDTLPIKKTNFNNELAFTLNADLLENNLLRARSGDYSGIGSALDNVLGHSKDTLELARVLTTLKPMGEVEMAAFGGNRLLNWREIRFLCGHDDSIWAEIRVSETTSVTLQTLNGKNLPNLLRTNLDNISSVQLEAK